MLALPQFARTLGKLMARWPGARENRAFAPLERPARNLFGSSLSETGVIPAALFDLRSSGPLLADVLRAHPSLSGEDPSRTLGALFGNGQ